MIILLGIICPHPILLFVHLMNCVYFKKSTTSWEHETSLWVEDQQPIRSALFAVHEATLPIPTPTLLWIHLTLLVCRVDLLPGCSKVQLNQCRMIFFHSRYSTSVLFLIPNYIQQHCLILITIPIMRENDKDSKIQ